MKRIHPMLAKYFTCFATRMVGICPYHTETTGSCCLDLVSGKFHCFGCGKSGTIDELESALKEKYDE
jgi:hypothetical protein